MLSVGRVANLPERRGTKTECRNGKGGVEGGKKGVRTTPSFHKLTIGKGARKKKECFDGGKSTSQD